jgi:23S rRNA pseudouridine1911/1915/1917 synthase
MPVTTKTARVTEELSGRADRVVQSLTGLSHSKMRGLFDNGCVTINGGPSDHGGQRVKPGDQVAVCYDPQQGYREKKKPWTDRAFLIVYEDEHIIVVNKSAGVLTVATDLGEPNALADRVSHYLKSTSRQREAFVAHRLDRGVSGLLVFAKSPAMLARLQEQFRERKPERLYIAIVAGVLKSPAGTFRSYLETGDNLDQFSTPDERHSQLAITHYRVQHQLPDTTVVEVRLETGRRNQIRVHFADHGHPVLGDPRYGRHKTMHERWPKNRLALHAISLGFEHPATGQPMRFESPLPKTMRLFIGKN